MWPPPSVLPDDPIVAQAWRRVAEREEDEARARAAVEAYWAAREEQWRLPALRARADRYLRAVREVLAESETRNSIGCDCAYCSGRLDGGELEYRVSHHYGQILDVR